MASIGDIAFVGYASDNIMNGKSFAFVVLEDLSGQTFYFTDNGFISSTGLKSNEGTISITIPQNTAIGTTFVVTSTSTTGTTVTANGATVPFTKVNTGTGTTPGNVDFAVAGDQVLVYQGSPTAPTFLYALNFYAPGYGYVTTAANNSTDLPTGLTTNSTALSLSLDNAAYSGPLTGTKAEILANIANVSANWTANDTDFVPYAGQFTVTGANTPATETVAFQSAAIEQIEGNTGSTVYTFTLTRTGSVANASTVGYAVSAASGTTTLTGSDFVDGVLPTGIATFAAGSSTATVTIAVAGDQLIEATEQFTLSLTAPSTGYVVGTTAGALTNTITNDDVGGTFSIATTTAATEGGAASFTVSRSDASGGPVDLTYAVTGGTADSADFVNGFPIGTVHFDAGQTSHDPSEIIIPTAVGYRCLFHLGSDPLNRVCGGAATAPS